MEVPDKEDVGVFVTGIVNLVRGCGPSEIDGTVRSARPAYTQVRTRRFVRSVVAFIYLRLCIVYWCMTHPLLENRVLPVSFVAVMLSASGSGNLVGFRELDVRKSVVNLMSGSRREVEHPS